MNIQWTLPADSDLDLIDVAYSTDNGSSWFTIQNNLASTTNNLNWTATSTETSNALVRVTIHDTVANKTAIQSGLFTIDSTAPANLALTYPTAAGINFKGGQAYNITWTTPTDTNLGSNPIKIELSLNGSFTDTVVIANNLAAAGPYSWTATTTQSTTAKIRVIATDLSGRSATSSSANPFILDSQAPLININTPNLGTILTPTAAGASATDSYSGVASISWVKSSGPGTINFSPSSTVANPSFSADLNGTYTALITATDNVGQSATSSISFIWDSGLVKPTIIKPVTGYYLPGGAPATISWNSDATQNHYAISYSLEGGSNWTSINSNYVGPASSIVWSVPASTDTSTAMVQVIAYDIYNNTSTATSTPFVIDSTMPVTALTNPTGATKIKSGTSLNITWTASDTYLDSNNIDLDYSIDNGANYFHVATSTNTGSYSWTATSTQSTSAKIRMIVKDLAGNTTTTSTPAFIIDSAGPIISINATSLGTISVSTAAGVTSVVDNYSGLASVAWAKISGPGTITFSASANINNPDISADVSGSYVARLTATDNVGNISTQNLSFVWDGNPGQPTVISPATGDYLKGGAPTVISWLIPGSSNLDYFDVEYYDGAVWNLIQSNIASTTSSISWSVPSVDSTAYQIRVTVYDIFSNSTVATGTPFIIDSTAPTGLSMIYPDASGINFKSGDSYNIDWNTPTDTYLDPNPIKIEYSNDGLFDDTVILSDNLVAAGPYSWTATSTETTNAKIKVSAVDLAGNESSVTSANPFTVDANAPIITVSTSSLGTISSPSTAGVSVADNYSGVASIVWTKISGPGTIIFTPNNTVADPSFSADLIGAYVAEITATDNVGRSATSTVSFSWTDNLTAPTVVDPALGVTWAGNSHYDINWTISDPGNLSNFDLEYSLDGGSNWTTITSVASTSRFYNWATPATSSTNALIRVTANSASNNSASGLSGIFELTYNLPTISIISPSTGDKYKGGTNDVAIQVSATNFIDLLYEYSSDGGSNWHSLGTSSSQTYSWTATTTESLVTKIRVTASNLSGSDQAVSGNFIIDYSVPTVTIATPNLGVISTPTAAGVSVSDSYSGVAGISWTKISGPGNIVFSPNATTTDTLLSADSSGDYSAQITATDNVGFATTSLVTFSWNGNQGSFSIIEPNVNSFLPAGSSTLVSWTSPGTPDLDHFDVEYALSSSGPWTSVVAGLSSSSNSVVWTVPSANSNTSLIRVKAVDIYSNVNTATSSTFTIDSTVPTISLTTPGGLSSGQTYNINWTASDNFLLGPDIFLEYSLDSGANWTPIATTTSASSTYAWTVVNTNATSSQLRATVWDRAGYSASSTTSDFTINSQGPVINISTPDLGTINSYTAAGVTVTDIYSGVASIIWTKVSGPGSVNFSGGNAIADPSFAATLSGTYVVEIVATNNFNNSSTSTVTFIWNGAPATPTLISPLTGDYLAGASTATVSWNSSLDPNLDYFDVAYSLDGGSTWNNIQNNVASTTFSLSWSVPAGVDTNVAMVKVTAFGISSDSTMTIGTPFVIDSTSPTEPTIINPNATTSPLKSGDSYNITWTPSVDSNFAGLPITIEYSADGLFDDAVFIANADATTTTYSWTVATATTSATNRLLITVRDLAGHITSSTSSAFIIDSLPAEITLTSDFGATSTPFHPNPTVTDNIDNASQLSYNWSVFSAPNGSNLGNLISAPFAAQPSLSGDVVGDYIIQLTVTDRAGNQATATTTYHWDVTLGQPVIIYPAGGESLSNGTVNILWNISSTSSLDHFDVDYSLDNGDNWDIVQHNIASTSNSAAWTLSSLNSTSTLIRVTALDEFSNSLTAVSNLFTLDSIAPSVSTSNLGTISSATAAGATASDNIASSSDLVYSWSVISAPAGANLGFSATNILNPTVSGNLAGAYAANLSVSDPAGNSASSTLSFTWYVAPTGSGGGGGGGGGGSYNPLTCTTVTYSAWGACLGTIQFRTVSSQAPSACSLTAAQIAAQSQLCSANIEEPTNSENNSSAATSTVIIDQPKNINGFDVDAAAVMDTARKYFTKTDTKLVNRVKGQIMIAVENRGRAWYVNPVDGRKYYLGTAANAYSVMRLLGTGMTNKNLEKIHVAFLDEVVKDIPVAGDTLATRLERALGKDWQASINKVKADPALARRFSGRIIIQVQANGEAWYVEPVSKKRFYLGRPDEAYALMRSFGVGINNANLNKIPVGQFTPAQLEKINELLKKK